MPKRAITRTTISGQNAAQSISDPELSADRLPVRAAGVVPQASTGAQQIIPT
jgi:hypothetical protein